MSTPIAGANRRWLRCLHGASGQRLVGRAVSVTESSGVTSIGSNAPADETVVGLGQGSRMAVVIGVRGSRSLRRWFTRGADTTAWFLAAEMRKAGLAPADGRVLSRPDPRDRPDAQCRVRGIRHHGARVRLRRLRRPRRARQGGARLRLPSRLPQPSDTIDRLDFEKLSRAVSLTVNAVRALGRTDPPPRFGQGPRVMR